MRRSERGEGIVEVVVAAALISIAFAAVISGSLAAAHRFGAQPVDRALQALSQRELRVAVDVLKYQGGSIAPVTLETTAPLPGGSPVPIHLSIAATSLVGGGYSVIVHAAADGTNEGATASATVPQPVPLPSSEVPSPGNAPAPL